ncbi:SHOCT domain-containing protein [Clostridium sp. 'White wine YQ']|uniref:SHOCT domain-containing protein n=1 Tax=Clostridium sp. 'White wine YQ' TaxID=3027474 RepID=UPI0023662439|nr:SHOCT domain-containing protein [Clostridium sp. 'White wine YQ']MDD7793714.1 SHOCT domain-containing protein [Clostridium sp. 'White wine YQ']
MGIRENAIEKKAMLDKIKKLKKEGRNYYSRTSKYVGGGALPKASSGIITVNSNGVFFEIGFAEIIHISLRDITKAEYLDNTQVTKDVTLTRMLLVGPFAFALKKTKKAEQFFVVINYNVNGMESKIIFEDKRAMEVVSAIIKAKSQNNKIKDELIEDNSEKHIQSDESINNETDKDNIIDLIKELAELKEQGILTEEEFSEKKKELLARL